MAATATMRTILANPVTRLSNRTRSILLVPSKSVIRLRRNASMQVRCMSEQEGQKEEPVPVTTPPQSPISTPLPTTSPKPVKASTSFIDVFAFDGPAPERINGRLAMIGFVAAMAVEVANGQDVFAQITNGGVPWFLGTTALLSLASVIPLFKGVSVQSKSNGFMTSDAELWNGRFAMLGLVALAFTEFVKGGALV